MMRFKIKPMNFPQITPALILVFFIAILIGAIVPLYVNAVGDKLIKLIALPGVIVLGALLCYDRLLLLGLIIFFRSGLDVILGNTKFSVGGGGVGVGALINLAVILIACILVIERPQILRKNIKIVTPWIGFLITAGIAVFISPDRGGGFRLFLGLLSNLSIFCAAFYFYDYKKNFKTCITLVVLSSIIPAIYALLDIALHARAMGFSAFRLQSTFEHPNILAFYLTLVISLLLYVFKSDTYKLTLPARTVIVMYAGYLMVLLLLTQTRSAWIACFFIFAIYGVFFERRYIVYLAILSLFSLAIPSVRDRLIDLASGNGQTVLYAKLNSFAWRQALWKSALEWMDVHHYLLGYGLNSFTFYSPTFFPMAGTTNFASHSLYIQWIFEVGALGFASLIWLFIQFFYNLKDFSSTDRLAGFIAIGILIQYAIVSFSDNLSYYLAFNWYFYFVIGAACAAAMSKTGIANHEATKPDTIVRTHSKKFL